MKKSIGKRIKEFLVIDLVKVKIKVPVWIIGFIILLPLIAYFDVTVIGKTTLELFRNICP